jgi:hypothetical protein
MRVCKIISRVWATSRYDWVVDGPGIARNVGQHPLKKHFSIRNCKKHQIGLSNLNPTPLRSTFWWNFWRSMNFIFNSSVNWCVIIFFAKFCGTLHPYSVILAVRDTDYVYECMSKKRSELGQGNYYLDWIDGFTAGKNVSSQTHPFYR